MFNAPSSKIVLISEPQDWQKLYKDLLSQIDAIQADEKIKLWIVSYFKKVNQDLTDYFHERYFDRQVEQLEKIIKAVDPFVETHRNEMPEAFLGLLANLKAIFQASLQSLKKTMDLGGLPEDVLYRMARKFLTPKEAVALARSSRKLYGATSDSDPVLLVAAKQKKLQELSHVSQSIGGWFPRGESFITQDGRVFVRGLNSGLGDIQVRESFAEFDPARLKVYPPDKIKNLQLGYSSSCLTEEGRCFVWGQNDYYQLGFTDKKERLTHVELDLKQFGVIPPDKVKTLKIKNFYGYLITESGKCVAWGNLTRLGVQQNPSPPLRLKIESLDIKPPDKIKKLDIGRSYLITEKGECIIWSEENFKLFRIPPDRKGPVKLDLTKYGIKPGDKVKKLKLTALEYGYLITEQGYCLVWGKNKEGVLGFGLGIGDWKKRDTPVQFDLKRLKLSTSDRIKDFSINYDSYLLTQEGRLFVWGENVQGQLGLGHKNPVNNPCEIELKELGLSPTDRIKRVVMHGGSTYIFTDEARCFVCGYNDGQLGLSDEANRIKLTEVFYPGINEERLVLQSIFNDIRQLSIFASHNTPHGKICYRALVHKLFTLDRMTQLQLLLNIQRSPWKNEDELAKLFPFKSLYKPIVDNLHLMNSPTKQSIIIALAGLLDLCKYFAENKSSVDSADQKIRQSDFVDLLSRFLNEEFKNPTELENHFQKTSDSANLQKRFQTTFFLHPVSVPRISTRYFDLRQKLLKEVQGNPDLFQHFKIAAEMILQSINSAEPNDSVAHALKRFVKTPQSNLSRETLHSTSTVTRKVEGQRKPNPSRNHLR